MEDWTLFSASAGLSALSFSLRWNWWRMPKSGIPVLMYHRIGVPPPGSRQKNLWVSPKMFDWQMGYLRLKGYETQTFRDLAQGRMAAKPVILTFDDGYLNQYSEAFPILRRREQSGVFYIVAQGIGRDNYWHDPKEEPRLPLMGKEQIREMRAAGMEFGSHALSHRPLAQISKADAQKEILESKTCIEDVSGDKVISFAFPYGNGEDVPELVDCVLAAGYGWVIGIHAGLWEPNGRGRVVPRVYVRGDDNKLDFYLQLTRGKSRV